MNTLTKIQNPLSDFFPLLFDEFETIPSPKFENRFLPASDVIENEDSYEVHLSLAGFEKTDFTIKVEENILTISGEKKKSEKKYNFKETIHGKFIRRFTLPKGISIEKINANYLNGILEINIPKDLSIVKSKVIEVQ